MHKEIRDLKKVEGFNTDAEKIKTSVNDFIQSLVIKQEKQDVLEHPARTYPPTMDRGTRYEPAKYRVDYKDKWDELSNEQINIKYKILDEYEKWYAESIPLVKRYLPDRLDEFKVYHENISLDFPKYVDKEKMRSEFENSFRVQKNIVLSLSDTKETGVSSSKNIFIVHGHDDEMKEAVAIAVKKLDLTPIILHEQTNEGLTIIEKIEKHSQKTSFAIILVSPDDMGCKSKLFPKNAKNRARQNVILEMGYFLGKLGREKVFVLYKESNDFEMPSDMLGIVYEPYDNGWENKMREELRSCGLIIT